MEQSKPYNFYSLNSVPALVSLNNDDYDEEPETDFSEEADGDKGITHFLTHKVIKEIPSFMRRNEKQLNIKMCKNVEK